MCEVLDNFAWGGPSVFVCLRDTHSSEHDRRHRANTTVVLLNVDQITYAVCKPLLSKHVKAYHVRLKCRFVPLNVTPPVVWEQELEDLDDDLDFDEEDMEDYGTPASGDGAGPSSPSLPPSDTGEGGQAGGDVSDAGDDLLGM